MSEEAYCAARRGEQAFASFAAIRKAGEDNISTAKIYIDMLGGDKEAAAILDELVFWTAPRDATTALRVRKDGVLWLAVTRSEWWERKRVTEREADRGIAKLIQLGLIEKKVFLFSGHARTHLRIIPEEFFRQYGKQLQKDYMTGKREPDEQIARKLTDLYQIMGVSESPFGESPNSDSPNGDGDSPNGDGESPNGDTINNPQQPASSPQKRVPSQKDFDDANRKVDAILAAEEKARLTWTGREKMPEPIRELLDIFVTLTGLRSTKQTLMDWLMSGQEWLNLGAAPADISAAWERAKKQGFAVTRPGSLTGTINAVVGERHRGVTSLHSLSAAQSNPPRVEV